ncbi:jg13438 [Pararge aegeria aegeria]|uniref:Jg13438 protein n=1 Tax=Pararge aegeria aegeria TaxID=348720 RepID=A0A8S4QNL2_9NEOP|nr:jg13438 [Pararge aegeria aegeria]
MFVDNAYNVPDMESPMRAIDKSLDLIVAVSAERTYATPGIRSFPIRDRECYYIGERLTNDVIKYVSLEILQWQKALPTLEFLYLNSYR